MSGEVVRFPRLGIEDPREAAARAVLSVIRARGADTADSGIFEAARQLEIIRGLISSREDINGDDPLWLILDEAERLFVTIPANTAAGAAAKLKFLAEIADIELGAEGDCIAQLLQSVLATLDAMEGGGEAA
jgi:hypothetical protein